MPDHFKLQEAIEAYLHQMDRNHLLSREEREEITDHLLTQTESLQEEGLSEREAFELAARHFGPSDLINGEYRRVKPFYNLRKAAIATALMVFFFVFIAGLLQAFSLVTALLSREFSLTNNTANILDVGLKVVLVVSMIAYLKWRFSRQHPRKIWEITLIPVLGLTAPFLYTVFTSPFFNTGYVSAELLQAGYLHNLIILTVIQLILLVVCYRLAFKWIQSKNKVRAEYATDLKAQLGILLSYFLSLALFTVIIGFISSSSLWLIAVQHFRADWMKLMDLVIKLVFLGGILAIVVSRINKGIFFKKLELLLIPLIGFAGPYLSDILLLSLFSWDHSKRKIFEVLTYNSQIVLGFAVLLITVATYLYMYEEKKRYRLTD